MMFYTVERYEKNKIYTIKKQKRCKVRSFFVFLSQIYLNSHEENSIYLDYPGLGSDG